MLEDTEGSIFYDNLNYDYRYKFGPTIGISIIAPMAESAFGNRPLEAFDLYLNSSSNDRENLVDEFRKDIKVISPVRLGEVFESLASPERLSRELNGTVALRQVSLSFVKDVLALGIDDLNQEKNSAACCGNSRHEPQYDGRSQEYPTGHRYCYGLNASKLCS